MNIYDSCEAQCSPLIDQACGDINEACKGFGTDEDLLTMVLASKSRAKRDAVARRYEELYSTTLRKLVKSETSGDYGHLMELLCVPVEEAEAIILRRATKGAGTDEKLLYPIICGRTNEELQVLKKTFFKLYNKDLAVVMDDELSGDLKNFITACLQEFTEEFDPAIHTDDKAEADADAIYNAGQGKWGTDEKAFYELLLTAPPMHLRTMDSIYAKKYGNSLQKAVKKEFSGVVEDALVYHIGTIVRPYETIAHLFEKTMKGFGTDENGLSACIVRYGHIFPQVNAAYEKEYDTTLRDRIYGETSGDYQNLLMTIIDSY